MHPVPRGERANGECTPRIPSSPSAHELLIAGGSDATMFVRALSVCWKIFSYFAFFLVKILNVTRLQSTNYTEIFQMVMLFPKHHHHDH